MILKNKNYHFFEFAIIGEKSEKKSNLISKILNYFKEDYNIFLISNFSPVSLIEQKLTAIDYDFVLIDSTLEIDAPCMKMAINNDFVQMKNIEIHHDDIKAICDFILDTFKTQYFNLPLNALVLIGGKSTRMGHDKGQINYHGKAQASYLAQLLTPAVSQVYYSGRADQEQENHLKDFPFIIDQFKNLGPIAGILSYFSAHPYSRVLVVACDMPNIDQGSIDQLIAEQSPFKLATCFKNLEKNWPEPLFTIYGPKTYSRLLQLIAIGHDCPMKMLFNSDIKKITPLHKEVVLNVNTQVELDQILGNPNDN